MSNKGWGGILVLIIFLSITSIAFFGYAFSRFSSSNFNQPASTESAIMDNEDSLKIVAQEILTEALSQVITFPQTTPLPDPSPSITPVPLPRVVTSPPIIPSPTPEPCYNFEIKSGDLKSNKCYISSDYNQIRNLYSDYLFEVDGLDFIENRIDITCDGSDFFADSCSEAKKDLKEQKEEIDSLKKEIQKIINRGK